MDSLEQWRAAIGSFASCISFKNCKFQKRGHVFLSKCKQSNVRVKMNGQEYP